MRLHLPSVRCLLSGLLLLSAQLPLAISQKLDHYGDPLPPGAVARLGTKRFQTKGGFGWTPDGKSLATLRGGTVYFWDLADGHCRETLLVPINADPFFSYGMSFLLSKDGQKLVCADYTGALATWDLATSQTASLPGDPKRRNEENVAVALHPDGKRFVTLSKNGELHVRDFATCKVQRSIAVKVHYWSQNSPAAFSPDGKRLVLGQDTTDSIYLLDIEKDAEPLVIKRAHSQSLYHVEFLADGRLVSVGAKRGPAGTADDPQPQDQLLLWDLSKQPPTSREFPLADTQPAGCSAAFSADGKTLVTVHADRLHIWDVAGERLVRSIDGPRFLNPTDAIVAIDPTGKYVAVDDRRNYVRLWELASGKPVLSTEQHHQSGVYAADWSPDGSRVATGTFWGEGRAWDAASGEPLVKFRGPDFGVLSLRYTSDGTQIVLCGDQPGPMHPKLGCAYFGPVHWHDAESGRRLLDVLLPARARLLLPSPDGSKIAVATNAVYAIGVELDDGEPLGPPAVRILDGKTGKELIKMDLGKGEAQALAWSADGQSLLAAFDSKVARFEVATGKRLAEVELPHFYQNAATKLLVPRDIGRAAFLGHGAEVVTTGSTEIFGWRLPAGEQRWTMKREDGDLGLLVVSRDEQMLAISSTATDRSAKLRLYDLGTRRLLTTFDLGRDSAECASFSPDNSRLLVGLSDGTALIYDVSDVK